MLTTRFTAYEILFKILFKDSFSNLLLKKYLENIEKQNPTIPKLNKSLIVQLVYGVLRNIFLLDYILKNFVSKKKFSARNSLLVIARLAIFEILFLEKINVALSVNEYVAMAKKICSLSEASFLNALLRNISKTKKSDLLTEILSNINNPIEQLSIEYSHPVWFVEKIIKKYGDSQAREILKTNNLPLPFSVRINTLKITKQDFINLLNLSKYEIINDKIPPSSITIIPNSTPKILTRISWERHKGTKAQRHKECNVGGQNFEPLQKNFPDKIGQNIFCKEPNSNLNFFPHKEYQYGYFTPQDKSTQAIAFFLEPASGETILDMCCGIGGKSTHIAEIMNNKGHIIACDKNKQKINILKKNCERLGISIIEPITADILTQKHQLGIFNKILLDVPCSGTGTFRKRPELRYKIKPDDILRFADLQYQMLEISAHNLSLGGTLLYSTCSILEEENEKVIGKFLNDNKNYRSDSFKNFNSEMCEDITILPQMLNSNAVYAAKIKKIKNIH